MAAIGPGISLCCFETHGDVPAGLRAGLGRRASAFIHPVPGTDQYHVDLKGANRRWLLRAGLSPDRIQRSALTAPPATAPPSGPTAGWAPAGAAWPL